MDDELHIFLLDGTQLAIPFHAAQTPSQLLLILAAEQGCNYKDAMISWKTTTGDSHSVGGNSGWAQQHDRTLHQLGICPNAQIVMTVGAISAQRNVPTLTQEKYSEIRQFIIGTRCSKNRKISEKFRFLLLPSIRKFMDYAGVEAEIQMKIGRPLNAPEREVLEAALDIAITSSSPTTRSP